MTDPGGDLKSLPSRWRMRDRYMLEIKPFEKQSGDYTLELKRVEAIAGDADGTGRAALHSLQR